MISLRQLGVQEITSGTSINRSRHSNQIPIDSRFLTLGWGMWLLKTVFSVRYTDKHLLNLYGHTHSKSHPDFNKSKLVREFRLASSSLIKMALHFLVVNTCQQAGAFYFPN